MSRSIHANNHLIGRVRRSRYADPEQQAELVGRLRRELATKREIKRVVRATRRGRLMHGPVAPESIPMHVRDEGAYVHYPASPADVVAVMRRLPPGVLDGIHSITLCLGKEYHDEEYGDDLCDPDPFTGRRGEEYLPGIFGGRCLGTYVDHHAGDRIIIFAYVYAPGLPDRDMWELMLRLWMLSTLMHEVAHFHHFSSNRRRGRWRGFQYDGNEEVADRHEATWVRRYVVAYLEETYPDAVRRFGAWLQHHGGTRVPLDLLAGSWRWDGKERFVPSCFFSAREALAELASAVTRGDPPEATRLEFARGLHYGENYPEALRVVAGLLEDRPDNLDALTLEADIVEHQGKHDVAQALAQRVLEADPSHVDAWMVLADAYQAGHAWAALLAAAQQGMDAAGSDRWEWGALLEHAARARLELRDYASLERDLATLAGAPRGARPAAALQAVMLLRTGRYEEALQTATAGLANGGPVSRRVHAAVRFEAAHKLGWPEDAGELSSRDLERLRSNYDEWADRLAAEYGISAA